MSPSAITFTFLNANNEASHGTMKHGDSIKIRTNESATGNYCFLGAWSTPSLYYYKKDYDIKKQGWTIDKIDLTEGKEIRAGDQVRIRNHHYTKKTFLAWRRTSNDNYLTTIADSNDETVWIIRGA